MSAWVVSKAHIDALTTFAVMNDLLAGKSPEQFGQDLWSENVRSVNYRYRHDEPEPVGNYWFEWFPVSATWLAKACACYGYQSCETLDWEQTWAFGANKKMQELALASLGMDMDQFCQTEDWQNGPWRLDERHRQQPWFAPDVSKYIAMEVRPVRNEIAQTDPDAAEDATWYQVCERDEAEMWTVYGRFRDGDFLLADALDDFPNELAARAYAAGLNVRYPHMKLEAVR